MRRFASTLHMKIILCLLLGAIHEFGLAVGSDTSENNSTTYSDNRIDKRIFGGQTPARDQYSYVARLLIRYNRIPTTAVCSGVVLNDKIILTAAQCMRQSGGKNAVSVRATLPWTSRSFLFSVDEIFVHPSYNGLYGTNIAILRKDTQRTFMIGFGTPPALPPQIQQGDELPALENAVVVGWGMTSDSKTYPRQLRYGRVTALDQQTCRDTYEELWGAFEAAQEQPYCTDTTNIARICEGDWGGPLINAPTNGPQTIAGLSIYRRSAGCNNAENSPGVYYPVGFVTDWIVNSFALTPPNQQG